MRRSAIVAVGAALCATACAGSSTSQPTTTTFEPTTAPVTASPLATTAATASTAVPSGEPATWGGIATYSFGSPELSIFDSSGTHVHTIETSNGPLLVGARRTVVPGRYVGGHVTSDGHLIVLDLPAGTVQEVDVHGGRTPNFVPIGEPYPSYALMMPAEGRSDPFGTPSTISLVDLRTLSVVDVRQALGIDPEQYVYSIRAFVGADGTVALTVNDPTSGERWDEVTVVAGTTTVVFEPSAPERALRVRGYIRDLTRDHIAVVRTAADGRSLEAAVLDRAGLTLWSTPTTAPGDVAIMGGGRVLVVSGGTATVFSTATGVGTEVAGIGPVEFGTWIGQRRRLIVRSDASLYLLDENANLIKELDGHVGASFENALVVLVFIRAATCLSVTDSRGSAFALFDVMTGNVLATLSMDPTAASEDGCSVGSDARTPGELVLQGTKVPLAGGEVVAAISPDGSAALVIDRAAKRAVVRTAAGPSADVVLPEITGGTFVDI